MLVTSLGRMSFQHGGVPTSTKLSTGSAIIAPGSRQSQSLPCSRCYKLFRRQGLCTNFVAFESVPKAPEWGRQHVARGVSPWGENRQTNSCPCHRGAPTQVRASPGLGSGCRGGFCGLVRSWG